MKLTVITMMLLLTGCASVMQKAEPYFDTKIAWQNDSGSDWMLRSARSWVDDGRWRTQFGVGLEWDGGWDCPYLQTAPFQSLNWTHIGCGKRWGGNPDKLASMFVQLDLRHQVDSMSDWWLRTDPEDLRNESPQMPADSDIMRYNAAYHDKGIRWTGDNPFYHLRFGVAWKRMVKHNGNSLFRFRCPVAASGRSLTRGRPLKDEAGQPDLYWFHLECNARFGGK